MCSGRVLFFVLAFGFTIPSFAGLLDRFYEIPAHADSYLEFGEYSETALDPESFEVLVWNIYKAKKKSFIPDFVSSSRNIDILMLQEVATGYQFERGMDFLPGSAVQMGISFIHKTKKRESSTGTAIGGTVAPAEFYYRRTKEREPVVHTPKMDTFATYEFKGNDQKLLVANIHGLNMTDDSKFKNQIDYFARMISRHDGPVVFGGDFNSKNTERLNYLYKTVNNLGLMPLAFEDDKRMKSRFSRLVIDHVFVKGLRVHKAKVYGKLKGSDHKAMYFKASLNP